MLPCTGQGPCGQASSLPEQAQLMHLVRQQRVEGLSALVEHEQEVGYCGLLLVHAKVRAQAVADHDHGRIRVRPEALAARAACLARDAEQRDPEGHGAPERDVRAAREEEAPVEQRLPRRLALRGRRAEQRAGDGLRQPQARGEGLRVVAEDEAEVDVEEVALRRDLEIVQMPVANAQAVCGNAIRGDAAAQVVERLLQRHGLWPAGVKPRREVAVGRAERLGEGHGARHELHVASVGRHGQNAVGGQAQRLVLRRRQALTPDALHERKQLQHELVLPQVIAHLHHVPLHFNRLLGGGGGTGGLGAARGPGAGPRSLRLFPAAEEQGRGVGGQDLAARDVHAQEPHARVHGHGDEGAGAGVREVHGRAIGHAVAHVHEVGVLGVQQELHVHEALRGRLGLQAPALGAPLQQPLSHHARALARVALHVRAQAREQHRLPPEGTVAHEELQCIAPEGLPLRRGRGGDGAAGVVQAHATVAVPELEATLQGRDQHPTGLLVGPALVVLGVLREAPERPVDLGDED
mmetsp:Transcript_28580/g.87727  ORF Transcript_28580/g.87727 Transcript_28580/m.87727 type:complete len:522 (+) Transcript_28580:54-1619(+)